MGRPRKYAHPAQAAAARAERDRQHTQARAARRIQNHVPRFIPYMPLPASIPSPTPDQLNLRTDLPSVIALSPRLNERNDVSLQGRQLRLPYRLSPPLPLPASALSPINDEAEGSVMSDNRSATPYSASSSFRQQYGSAPLSGRSEDGDDADNLMFEEDENDHDGRQEVGDISLATSHLSSSRSQSPAPANIPGERSTSGTPPSEYLSLSSEVTANEEDQSEVNFAPNVSESIATHLAEQLYQFKGCADHQHQAKEQAFQISHVPTKHGDIRQLTKHLKGLSDRDATPLPDVLSSSAIMSRGSIPNCNFEQIFEGQVEGGTQSTSPSSLRSAIDILSSSPSRHESDSDLGELLPPTVNVASTISLSRAGRTNHNHNSVDNISASITTSRSATISAGDEATNGTMIDAITPCLEAFHGQSRRDAPKQPSSDISFDVDSTCCFPSSLAIASQGILAYSTMNKAANLAASAHFAICDSTVNSNNEVVADSVPLHLVPHYVFGQVVGLPDMLIYIFFPLLRHGLEYKTSTYLSNEDQDIWFDTVLLPCLNKAITSSNKRQHHPPSRRVAELESTAASAEGYAHKISSRQQILRYPVPPEHLDLLWRLICTKIEEAVAEGMAEARFANPLLFITNKNSKLHYMESGPVAETLDLLPRAFDRWHRAWTAATDSTHYKPESLFIDLAKQMTSSDSELPPAPVAALKLWPEVYTWKKCCLDTYLKERVRVTRGSGRRTGTGNYPDVAHYPFATLRDTGGMTVASQFGSVAERSGLVYTQFYNLVKNAFDAAKVYPFDNEALENLALDPDYVASLKHVGKSANTFSIEACRTSYLHSKKRTHAAMLDNQWRSFGTREEHRVSLKLALKMMSRWRQWQHSQQQGSQHERQLEQLRQNVDTPYFHFYSPDIFAFLRAQVNRFCFLFEQVYSWLGPSHSLEEFVMMTLALRALRFSYGSSVLAAESTLYKDKWSTQTGEAKEGLGLGVAMSQCGFGWLLPKIEWATFRVRAEHSSQLVVGMPLLHSSYLKRWRQVRDLGDVHMRLHQAQGWALKYRIGKGRPSTGQARWLNVAQTAKGTAWLSYLTALNIVEFRAEIARHLLMSNKKHPELSEQMVESSASARLSSVTAFQQLSYSVHGMSSVFKVGEVRTNPHMATGNKSHITSSWVLVEMLFGWAGTVWKKPRGGWAKKPYRMILRKTFELIERVLGRRTADAWLHHFKLVIMLTHWILPYVTATSFLPLTKSNRNSGQQARTTWFSTVYEEPYWEKGNPQTTAEPVRRDEERLTLAEATRNAWSRHKLSRKGSTEDLVHIIAEAGLELPKLGGHDTGRFQLGRRQIGTNIYPYWESGRPPHWPAVFTLPNLTILELDEYFCQKMDAADRVPPMPAPAPAVHLKREPVSRTQSLYGLDVHLTGDTSEAGGPGRVKHTPRLVRNMGEPPQPEAIDSIIHKDPDAWDFVIYEDEPDEDPRS